MTKINGYTQAQLDAAKDWDIQYIPEWALEYILYGDTECYTDNDPMLDGEELKEINNWEISMIRKGFKPKEFKFIKWDCDRDNECLVYQVDDDPIPAFSNSPAFGLPCGVYRVLYVKLDKQIFQVYN